jgi:hypothetical protein
MLARWQEAAVLLFARGLGTNGEMDTAAEDAAAFADWCDAEQHKHHEGSACTQDDKVTKHNYAKQSQQSQEHVADGPNWIGDLPAAELDAAIESALGQSAEGSRSSHESAASSAYALTNQAGMDGVRQPPPAYPALQARAYVWRALAITLQVAEMCTRNIGIKVAIV